MAFPETDGPEDEIVNEDDEYSQERQERKGLTTAGIGDHSEGGLKPFLAGADYQETDVKYRAQYKEADGYEDWEEKGIDKEKGGLEEVHPLYTFYLRNTPDKTREGILC